MKDLFVENLPAYENKIVRGLFVATNCQVRTKADGSAYLCVTLGDRTGQLDGRLWELRDQPNFQAGDVVEATGLVNRYQNKLQIKLDSVVRSDPAQNDPADFIRTTEHGIEPLWARLQAHVATFTDANLRQLVESILADAGIAAGLRKAPAAKSLHHAFRGGLLEHVVSLLDLCASVAEHYANGLHAGKPFHRDLLLTGAILHDLGKVWELSPEAGFEYTIDGQLLGHISIGAAVVTRYTREIPNFPPRLRTLVLHMILSHHGRYEYGSPKLPMIPEAMVLHYLDDMEAKMETMRGEFRKQGADSGKMTDWIRALERPILDTRAYLADEPGTGE